MRLRMTLVSALAVFLLSVSCVSSACDLSCALKSLGRSCHGAVRAEDKNQMASMEHCLMVEQTRQTRSRLAVVGAAGSCQHCTCQQQPALISAKSEAATNLVLIQNASSIMAAVLPAVLDSKFFISGASPLRTLSHPSLHIALRV